MMFPGLVHVTGNIATGKTTLATQLASRLEARLVVEPDLMGSDPYWHDFAMAPAKWAMHQQLVFLLIALECASLGIGQRVVQDFCPIGSLVFADAMFKRGWFQKRDHQLYTRLVLSCLRWIQRPDVVIWLWVPDTEVLTRRIVTRARSGEETMDKRYLEILQDEWAPSSAFRAVAVFKTPVIVVASPLHDTRNPMVAGALIERMHAVAGTSSVVHL